MKRIESVKEKEKKERRKQQMLSGIMAFILIFSLAGYAMFSNSDEDQSEKRNYEGIDFYQYNGLWNTEINGKNFVFYSLPYELDVYSNISLSLNEITEKPLYFVGSYPYTLTSNLEGLVLRMQNACVENETCLNENYPIKSCEEDFILILEEKNNSKIYQDGKCIYLEGNLTEVSDKFIYEILEIGL